MKPAKTPFLFVPQTIPSDAYIVLTRISFYVKAMEEALVRGGMVGFKEVEKIASRNEALAAIDQINAQMDEVKNMIAQEWDPDKRAQMTAEWETSENKSLLQSALGQYKQQLAEALGDDI